MDLASIDDHVVVVGHSIDLDDAELIMCELHRLLRPKIVQDLAVAVSAELLPTVRLVTDSRNLRLVRGVMVDQVVPPRSAARPESHSRRPRCGSSSRPHRSFLAWWGQRARSEIGADCTGTAAGLRKGDVAVGAHEIHRIAQQAGTGELLTPREYVQR